MQAALDRLDATKTRLAACVSRWARRDVGLSYTRTLLVPNKIDLPDARDAAGNAPPGSVRWIYQELVSSARVVNGPGSISQRDLRALDVIRDLLSKLPAAKETEFNGRLLSARGAPWRRWQASA